MYSKWIFILNYWDNIDKNKPLNWIIGFLFFTCSFSTFANDKELLQKIKLLENEYMSISADFYLNRLNLTDESSIVKKNIKALSSRINFLIRQQKITQAIQLIYHNVSLIEDNFDHEYIYQFAELLLENNEFNLANSFFKSVISNGDDFQIATFNYLFAKYYALRNEWSKVNDLLSDISSELSSNQSEYASLLKGTALQHLKLHRKAIESYKKIPEGSDYFRHSQLNTAIAQIRQGWLTDAKATIQNITDQANQNSNDELTNRVYLVLGYAYLQQDYYRNARDVFRKISQDSQYVNRALLGIILCAINQKDYESALNSLSILKSKQPKDISIDESYLLTSYVFEKMEDDNQVVASSTEAMDYYQKRIVDLQKINQSNDNSQPLNFVGKPPTATILGSLIEYGKTFPVSFLENYNRLIYLAEKNKSEQLAKRIEQAISSYNDTLQLVSRSIIDKNTRHLKSYLSQSQYGLARLYDDSGQEALQ